MSLDNPVIYDSVAAVLTGGITLALLLSFEETAKRGVFDQKLNRKLVHICFGLVFMLFWPLFSSGNRRAILAVLVPGINIPELLKGQLYYATTMALTTAYYWRTSPIATAAICNTCAGDGLAAIIGRQFGRRKIPYNSDKSWAGSIVMSSSGFLASLGCDWVYFSLFGFILESWGMALGFFLTSLASTLVESRPVSSELDDNLTVPLSVCFLTY